MRAALLRRRRGGGGFGYLAANGFTPDLVADFVRGRYAYAVSHAGGYRPQRCDFADLFTHSRSGSATMVGADGTLQWAPHNLLTYSEDFSNAAWTKERNTATANAAAAPNGAGTASSIVPTAVSGTHTVIQSFTPVPEVECPFYFKANGYDYVSVRVDNAASKRVIQSFNLSSGAKDGSLTQATFTGSSSITDLGDGWYKCTVRAVWDGTSLISRVVLFVNETPGNTEGETFTGDGSSGIYIWGSHSYRSDLGGMAPVPVEERGLSTSATYLPTTSAARYLPRHNHHVYEGGQWVNKGLLIESELRTQLLHETDALTTQTETVTAQPYTLHFTGTGTVTLSGASTAGPLVGTGTGEENRVSLTFTPSAGTLTLTVSGTVTNAQLEAGSTPSSYIPNLAASGSVTRAAETQSAASGNWAYDSSAMWGAFDFTETYADEGTAGQVELLDIRADANNRITITLDTDGAETGELTLTMVNGGTSASVAVDALSPGIWQEAKFAWRVTDSDIAISLNGASEVRTATAIGIPNLSAAAMQFEGMGTRALITQGAGDVGAAGIEGASA